MVIPLAIKMGELLDNENDLILREYSADYDVKNISAMTVYLSITPQIHYQIQINFQSFPEKPQLTIPQNLIEELGDPLRFLKVLREWDSHNPPHAVEIIRELEKVLQRVIYPNDEMEEVMMEFNSYMSGPYKLHVLLYSHKMKTYEFEIIHQKLNPPSLLLTPPLEKILKINEISSLKQWPRLSLIDICREISKKIDHRTRIMDELKYLEKNLAYQKIIKKWDSNELVFEVRIEIETDEYCVVEVNLSEDFPMAPPNLELRTVKPEENRNSLNEFLLSQYNQWQHANTVSELLDDIKNFVKQKSKKICQNCHQYHCPKCNKPIAQTKLHGISGELNCIHKCNSCNANFHKCCWTEQIKHSRKCPSCHTQQRVLY